MELTAFGEFALVFGLASILGIILTKLKQPALLGYILCGLIIGPFTPHFVPDVEAIELFSKIGITLLLFILGLELNFNEIKSLGKVAFYTGIGQIVFTSIAGFAICMLLGYSPVSAIYLAIGLTFSSTIIIIKLLSEKKQLESLFGRISLGFLLVQDLVAIIILIVLSTLSNVEGGDVAGLMSNLGIAAGKGVLLAVGVYLVTKFVLNPILTALKKEKEVIFVTVIAWALLLASITGSEFMGFSIEIGGLIAGIALANRFENLQISSWTKPLRDFFILLFFVLLGLHVELDAVQAVIWQAVLLSVFVLIGNPLIVVFIMKTLGYSKRVSFFTSLAVAQISEFSLIVASFGFNLGHVDSNSLTLLTLVGGMTMAVSTYFIYYNEAIYRKLEKFLDIFHFKKDAIDDDDEGSDKPDIVMFGCHRMGKTLIEQIPKFKKTGFIVDFDPQTVGHLNEQGYKTAFADINHTDLYESFGVNDAKIVISTVPLLSENSKLINYISGLKHKPILITAANDKETARILYEKGSDFVVYPHLLGSEVLARIIRKASITKSVIRMREKHRGMLEAG